MTDVTPQTRAADIPLDPTLSPRPDLRAAGDAERAPATARLERALRSGRQWCESRSGQARDMVRAHPLRSGLAAVGAGVVVGMMLRRR